MAALGLHPHHWREEAVGAHRLDHQEGGHHHDHQRNRPERIGNRRQMPAPGVECADDDMEEGEDPDQAQRQAIGAGFGWVESLPRQVVVYGDEGVERED